MPVIVLARASSHLCRHEPVDGRESSYSLAICNGATSGNDARFDADSAVLVASKQKAVLQEHAKALALRTSMSCALCPTPFAQQHLKLLG